MKSHTLEQTRALGRQIAMQIFPGAFVALHGDLGAGKTALAHGIGEGLGVQDVTSPTFTIVQEHNGRLPLYHFDAYRLSGEQELYDIGFTEYLFAGGVILMEWTERVPGILPRDRLDVYIKGSADEPREIRLQPTGARYEALVQAVCQEYADIKGEATC